MDNAVALVQIALGAVAVLSFAWFVVYLLDLCHLVVTAGSDLSVTPHIEL